MGILDQAEFNGRCPNFLKHAQEGANRHHSLDSQDFLCPASKISRHSTEVARRSLAS